MKKLFISLLFVGAAVSAAAQGSLLFANYVNGVLLAPIYGVDTANPFIERHGQSPLGIPGGSTVYPGPLLNGPGYSVALYAGPYGASVDSLTLAATSTFRSSTSQSLPAGLWFSQVILIPGVGEGERVTVDIRVWDNNGGTIATWEQALQNGVVARGSSGAFSPLGILGSSSANGLDSPLALVGLTSFNIAMGPLVPEPTVFAVLGLGALFLLRRRFV